MKVPDLAALGRYECVYFSPHLDDVALSCAAQVLAHRQAGRRVLVATFFSHPGDADAGPFRCADYPTRQAEDLAANEAMGADTLHLGLPDAPFRSAQYRTFEGILFARDPSDQAMLAQARAAAAEVLQRTGAAHVFAPLGVGEHVDHRIAHAAVPGAACYEDRPYALVARAVELRLAVLGAGPALRDAALETEFLPALLEAPMAQALAATPQARHQIEQGYRRLNREAPAPCFRAAAETLAFDASLSSRVQQVFEHHASQVQAITGGPGHYVALLSDAAARMGHPGAHVERLWRLAPG
ncbi:MAG: PIG-L family deacetylase [Planctomycetes bacterium]|nr:PIG-L family deacetylase [Planctomycetota bacterium]